MRRVLVAFSVVAAAFLGTTTLLPIEVHRVAAGLDTPSGATTSLPRNATFLEANLADEPEHWEITGTVTVFTGGLSALSDPTEGDFSNTNSSCVGSDADEFDSPSARLIGENSAIRSEVFTIPAEDARLELAIGTGEFDPEVTVNLYKDDDSFTEPYLVFQSLYDIGEKFTTSCDLSTFAGENVKIEFVNTSTGTPFVPEVHVLHAGVSTATGSFTFSDLSPDPVSLISGALTHGHTDLIVPGRGIPLEFSRSYSSAMATQAADLGSGWSHNYAARLREYTDGSAEVIWPDGQRQFFTYDSGDLIPAYGSLDALIVDGGTYLLTTPSQITYKFDALGRLESMTDRNANTTSVAYDGGSTEITTVTDPGGRTLSFTYTDGRISAIEDPLSRTVEYAYDGGDLVKVTDVKAGETDFEYDNHRLLNITNALEKLQVTNTYDTADRVVKQVDGESGITCFHYGVGPSNPETTDCPAPSHTPSAGETVMVDPRGVEEIHQFDTSFRPTVIQRTVDSNDVAVEYVYETAGARCTYESDAVTLLDVPFGNRCAVIDPLGNVTSYRYDAAGNLLTSTSPLRQPDGAPEENAECGDPTLTGDGVDDDSDDSIDDGCPDIHYTYTALNDVETVTDARGNVTSYDYDGDGNLIKVTDPLSNETEFDWETGSGDSCSGSSPADRGMLCKVIDGLDEETLFFYDEYGNQTSVEDPLGNVVATTFDLGGRAQTVTKASRTAVSAAETGGDCGSLGTGDGVDDDSDTFADDGCPSLIMEYDDQNNVTKVIDAFVIGGPAVTNYIYDAVGNRTGMRDANRQVVGSTESGSNCDSSTGTGNGVDNDSDGAVDDGCLTVAYQYDDKNRLTAVIQARITGAGSPRMTEYTYDENDNALTLEDPLHQGTGRFTEYTYDEANRLTLVEQPDVHYSTTYDYDLVGRRTVMTDTRGACEIGVSGNCAANTTMTDTTTYDWDANGRLESVATDFDDTNGDIEHTVSFGYDAAGNRTSITYPDSKVAAYDYDALNRMETVDPSWYSGTVDYVYDAAGRLDLATLPSSTGITTNYGYDDAGRLTSIANNDGSNISSFVYDLDADGNRVELTDTVGVTSKVSFYTYDTMSRVTGVQYPEDDCQYFEYDLVGNRTELTAAPKVSTTCDGSPTATTYTYDQVDQLKAISSVGSDNIHDDDGNLLSIGTGTNLPDTFLYDLENRLYRTGPCRGDVNGDGVLNSGDQLAIAARIATEGSTAYDKIADLDNNLAVNSTDQLIYAGEAGKSCKNSGTNTGNARHWYNGDGLRMRQRTFYTSPTRVDDDYVWDQGVGLPVVLQDIRDALTGTDWTTTYLYGIGLISETNSDTGATHFYLSDGLGSSTELVEDDGDTANSYRYDVWGALRSSSGSVANQIDFTGEQVDHNANRGLVYLRARHYDPALGRFLSRDSVPAANRYSYGLGNPIRFVDRTGFVATESMFGTPYYDYCPGATYLYRCPPPGPCNARFADCAARIRSDSPDMAWCAGWRRDFCMSAKGVYCTFIGLCYLEEGTKDTISWLEDNPDCLKAIGNEWRIQLTAALGEAVGDLLGLPEAVEWIDRASTAQQIADAQKLRREECGL